VAAKNRDEANGDPRRKDIPVEITSLTNKIDDIKVQIESDKTVQQDLRRTMETQSSIDQKKEQCRSDLEELNIKLADYRFQLQAYKITPPPHTLPGDDTDKRGEELKQIIEKIGDEINCKFEDRERELNKNQDTARRIQAVVSEKKALLNHNIQSSRTSRQKLIGLQQSIEKTKQVVEHLRSFESRDLKIPTPVRITESRPEELLSYLTKQLEKIESESTDEVPPEMVMKVVKKLFTLANPENDFNCPCCDRTMEEDDITRFEKSMRVLASEEKSRLFKIDENAKIAKVRLKTKLVVVGVLLS
jgi:DNA repair protein RAD50